MRISDWSSDGCSSDLGFKTGPGSTVEMEAAGNQQDVHVAVAGGVFPAVFVALPGGLDGHIGVIAPTDLGTRQGGVCQTLVVGMTVEVVIVQIGRAHV